MPAIPACQSGTRHPDTWHSNQPAEQAEARAVCLACPTRAACQTAILAAEQGLPATDRHGIWAGLDGDQRAALDPTAPIAPPESAEPVKELSPCGTPAAYRRHIRKGEPADQECQDANTEYDRKRRARASLRRKAAA